MRKLDRLIVLEIVGPWFFGLGMFTALIMAATYLDRLVGYIADGASVLVVFQLMALMLPAIVVKTFPMSLLLSGLLGFGRLSSDSELVAMRAGGASLYRIVGPVFAFSLFVTGLTLFFNEMVVPASTRKMLELGDDISRRADTSHLSVASPVIEKQRLVMVVAAASVDPVSKTMHNVVVTSFDKDEKASMVLEAKEVEFAQLNPPSWRVKGGGRLISWNRPGMVIHFTDAWPKGMPTVNRSLSELLMAKPDQDTMTMAQLQAMIARHELHQDVKIEQLNDYKYWYWNKWATPLAALCFGCLGAVLGIRNHRTGTAAGFALSIGIIFGYMLLTRFMNQWAMRGIMPSWAASFAPLLVGAIATIVILERRNR